MRNLAVSALATGILGASVIALAGGGVQSAAAAPFTLLSNKAVSAESPIVQARYRARNRSSRRVRSARRARSRRIVRPRRYGRRGYIRRGRRRNAAAAAMIGAFGTIVAAAIAADARRDRYAPYAYGYAPYYPSYGYAPGYYRPRAYYPARVHHRPHVYHAPVVGGYYVKRKRRGLGRIFGRRKKVFVPYRAAPRTVYHPGAVAAPGMVVGGRIYRPGRAFRPHRGFRSARRMRRIFGRRR